MKTRLILLTLIASFLLFGAQTKPGLTTETEDVPRFTYVQHEASWYKDQMIAWKEVLDVQPKNAPAWKNYFYAHRYYKLAGGQDREGTPQEILEEMKAHIHGTWEYMRCSLFEVERGQAELDVLAQMEVLRPEIDPDLYGSYITAYEWVGQWDKAKESYKALAESNHFSPALIEWNYNMLMSCAENAILITAGDNDTYPSRMLQEAAGVRTDVCVVNLSLSQVQSWRNDMFEQWNVKYDESNLALDQGYGPFAYSYFDELVRANPDRPVYLAISTPKWIVDRIQDSLYNEGLANRYSSTKVKNMVALENNWFERFHTDYLDLYLTAQHHPQVSVTIPNDMNYLPALMSLHTRLKGDRKEQVEKTMRNILTRAGIEGELDAFLNGHK